MFASDAQNRSRLASLRLPALVLALVAAYASIVWCWARPAVLSDWRQADTQTIASYMAEPGSSILLPRIAWGGSGPGYVEAEFQLYTWLVSRLLLVFGDAEWPGRLVSLLSVVAAALVTWRGLNRWYSGTAAALGVAGLLASRGVVYAATSIQPEALCLLLYVGAWFAFLEYERVASARALVGYALLGGLAMLVKPTAAQLGVSTFFLLLFGQRARLRDVRVWLAWLVMVGMLAAHLLHARSVYLEYGNTFGVLSGGDSKIPKFTQLFVLRHDWLALRNLVRWGLGPHGLLALMALLVLSRARVRILALLVGNVAWTLLALRYTSNDAGNHYHLLAALLSAHAVAQVVDEWRWPKTRALAALALGAGILGALALSLKQRHRDLFNAYDEVATAVSGVLKRHAKPHDLVVIRSPQEGYDTYWQTPNNFQDPRVFYQTRTRGWALSLDDLRPESIAGPASHGASFYVETVTTPHPPSLSRWLSLHARWVGGTPFGGAVYSLRK